MTFLSYRHFASLAIFLITVIQVEGMVCGSCEKAIEKTVKKQPGIISVKADFANEKVTVDFDPNMSSREKIIQVIEGLNFNVKD